MICGLIFSGSTGWLDVWNWRRVFDCIFNGPSTCIPTWIYKPWKYASWRASGGTSWLCFVSEEVRYCNLCGGVGIPYAAPSGSLITYNINLVRYCQLLEFITLALSPNWLIPYSGGRQRSAELASSRSNPFILVMDDDSCRLTVELLGLVGLLSPLVDWESPSLGMRVNILQESAGIGIFDEPVVFFLGSELDLPLRNILYSYPGPPVDIQLTVYSLPGSKLRYPDLVGYPSQYTFVVCGSSFRIWYTFSVNFHMGSSLIHPQ